MAELLNAVVGYVCKPQYELPQTSQFVYGYRLLQSQAYTRSYLNPFNNVAVGGADQWQEDVCVDRCHPAHSMYEALHVAPRAVLSCRFRRQLRTI